MSRNQEAQWGIPVSALVIQVLALCISGSFLDAGVLLKACILASGLFWICAACLLLWPRGRVSRLGILFLGWGLLIFVALGTPLFVPLVRLESKLLFGQ